MSKREGAVHDQMAKYARCARCGKKDFLMMRFIKGRKLRLCKKCYDYEIDRELIMLTKPQP